MKNFIAKILLLIKNSGFLKSNYHINMLFSKDIVNNKLTITFDLDLTKKLNEEIPKIQQAIRAELDTTFKDFICQNPTPEAEEETV